MSRILRHALGALLASALLVPGCAYPRLVPVPNGGLIDPQVRSASKSQDNVTVTIYGSAWRGSPSYLEDFVTPLYLVVQNDTDTGVAFGSHDLLLFDERRTQYAPIAPEHVVRMLWGGYWGPTRPFYGYFYFSSGYHRSHDPFFAPPWWWNYPPYYYERLDDVITQALAMGVVRPRARVQGFIYFPRLSSQVRSLSVQVGFELLGVPGKREVSFPFERKPPWPQ